MLLIESPLWRRWVLKSPPVFLWFASLALSWRSPTVCRAQALVSEPRALGMLRLMVSPLKRRSFVVLGARLRLAALVGMGAEGAPSPVNLFIPARDLVGSGLETKLSDMIHLSQLLDSLKSWPDLTRHHRLPPRCSHLHSHSPCCTAHYTPQNQIALHVPLTRAITTHAARLQWSRKVVPRWYRAPRMPTLQDKNRLVWEVFERFP